MHCDGKQPDIEAANRRHGGRQPNPTHRRRILDAGHHVLRNRRAGALTVEGVVRKAGIAKGSFYRHFASADELYDALENDKVSR